MHSVTCQKFYVGIESKILVSHYGHVFYENRKTDDFLFVFLVKDIARRTEIFTLVMRSEIPRNFNKQKFDSSVTAMFCNES